MTGGNQTKMMFASICIFFFSSLLHAQKMVQNTSGWIGQEIYLPFVEGGKWGLLLEGYSKGNNIIAELQGSFYIAGANYFLKNGNRLAAGLACQWDIPYDDVSLPYSSPDYRIFEQFIWRRPRQSGKHIWTQRFRMEQRWLGRKYNSEDENDNFDYYKFENTFRYQLHYQYWFRERWAAAIYDEVHVRTNAAIN